jgi:uncharacterized protein YjgD (DUF1641 family)
MEYSERQRNKQASITMSGNIVNFNAVNDGTPQVSILASASAKRMQERRRQSRLLKNTKGMGVGKKYPGVGTHHRNTKHTWLYSELAELSAAYMEHHSTMPCWAIADMLYYSFGEQVKYNQAKLAQQAIEQKEAEENDDQPICQLQEPRIHMPTIQAIQAKLTDCISLQHNETFTASIPTQMHQEVWNHLILAQKHREMLKEQASKIKIKQEPEEEQPEAMKPKITKTMRKLRSHDFLYNTDAEFEATLPPAKRRKVMFDDEDEDENLAQQTQQQIKQEEQEQEQEQQQQHPETMHKEEYDTDIKEIMSLLEDCEKMQNQERFIIQKLTENILQKSSRIGVLVSNIKDTHAEIELCREAINCSIEQIKSVINPASASASITRFNPRHYQCRECLQMFDPQSPGYYLIGPNPQTADIFYLCRECTMTPAPEDPGQDPDQEQTQNQTQNQNHDDDCCGGDCDCWSEDDDDDAHGNYYGEYELDYDSSGWDDQPPRGGYYDHAEECS